MPTRKHLIEELKKLSIDPDEVRIPSARYDDLLDEAEDIAEEENPTNSTEEDE